MKIAKPLLLVSTPLGVAWGLLEAYRLAGGLVILMAAMIGLLGVAAGTVVAAIRRESVPTGDSLAGRSVAAARRGRAPQSK